MTELIQELRIAQTGGQIFFAFLFTVAFTPVFAQADRGQRVLYAWALFVVAASVAFLVGPVAVHRLNFGRRIRAQVLAVDHVFAIIGLAMLAIGIVLGVMLIATFVFPDEDVPWLPVGVAGVLLVCWLVVPLALRAVTRHPDEQPQELTG